MQTGALRLQRQTKMSKERKKAMKKKLFCAGLAAMLALSVPASAEEAANHDIIQENNGTASHDVCASYAAAAAVPVVYAVEISWGSMEFTYNAATIKKTWDPKTHTYVEGPKTEGTWTCDETAGANKVSVTNKSNKALTATLAIQMLNDGTNDYTKINASAAQPTLNLKDASIGAGTVPSGTTTLPEGTATGTASTAYTTISLTGELTNKSANKTPIGNITVTIADAAEEVMP